LRNADCVVASPSCITRCQRVCNVPRRHRIDADGAAHVHCDRRTLLPATATFSSGHCTVWDHTRMLLRPTRQAGARRLTALKKGYLPRLDKEKYLRTTVPHRELSKVPSPHYTSNDSQLGELRE